MRALTMMALAAMALGAVAFAYDAANAQTPADCPTHSVSLYFEPGKSEFNTFSKQLVERVAAEAKACGAKQVVAETPVTGQRAKAVQQAFAERGVNVVLVRPARLLPAAADDSIAARSANVRLTLNRAVG